MKVFHGGMGFSRGTTIADQQLLLETTPMDSIKNKQLTYLYCSLIMLMGWPLIAGLVSFAPAQQSNAPADALTGNWVVRIPNPDGTSRLTYLNLKQEGSHITGSIRVTQFYYLISESAGGPEGFTLEGSMKDGQSVRR